MIEPSNSNSLNDFRHLECEAVPQLNCYAMPTDES